MPYISQQNTPAVNKEYMLSDKESVFLVLIVRRACGKNETVVKPPAI